MLIELSFHLFFVVKSDKSIFGAAFSSGLILNMCQSYFQKMQIQIVNAQHWYQKVGSQWKLNEGVHTYPEDLEQKFTRDTFLWALDVEIVMANT